MSIVRGGTGLTGAQQTAVESITNLADGTIPVVKDGKLAKGLATQSGNASVAIDGRVSTEKDTIDLGQGLSISEDGGSIKFSDKVDGVNFFPTGVIENADGTTAGNFTLKRSNPQTLPVLTAQNEVHNGDWTAWLPVTATKILRKVRMRFAQAADRIRITLRVAANNTQTNGIILYQSHTDSEFAAGEGFSVPESPIGAPVPFEFELTNAAKVKAGTLVYLKIEKAAGGTGALAIRGATTTIGGINQFYAWMEQDIVSEDKTTLATMGDNYPTGAVPQFDGSNFVASGISVSGSKVLVDKEMQAKKFKTKNRSIEIGPNFSVGNSADELEFITLNTGIKRTTGHTTYNDSTGTVADEHFNSRRVWDVDNSIIQSDFSENSGDFVGTGANTVAGEYRAIINTAHVAFPPMVQHYFVRMASDSIGCRLQVYQGNSLTSPMIYQSRDDFDFDDNLGARGRIDGQALTGTISVTSGSVTVTGVGTAFDTELVPDDIIRLPAQSNVEYVVKSVESATSLTLQAVTGRALPTITASGQSFVRGHTLVRTPGGFTFQPNTQYFVRVHNKAGNVNIKGKVGALGQTGQFFFYFERVWQDTEFPEIPTAAHNHIKHLTQVYAGSGSIAAGGTVVTATDSNFTTDFQVGDCFDLNGQVFTIKSIESNTSLTTNETANNATSAVGIYRHGDMVKWMDDAGREIFKVNQQRNFTMDRNVTIKGDLNVQGATNTVNSQSLNVTNNHVLVNDGYTAVAAKSGGLVVNYLPTSTQTTVASGAFTAGVASTSNPTVVTVGSGTFAASDMVLVSGSDNNDGLYEVHSHTGATLTVRGVGTVGTVENFTKTQFVSGSGNATITKVSVSVMRAGTDGRWEQGRGSTAPLTFEDVQGDIGTFTEGSLLFSDASGKPAQDNANLFWHDTNNRLGIKTSNPQAALHAKGSTLLGDRYTTAETSASVPTNFTAVGTPTNLTGSSGVEYESALRLLRDGESGTKYNMTADWQMGTYAGGLSARSGMRLRMGNGNAHTPDTDVAHFYADGSASFGTLGVGITKPSIAGNHKLQIQGGGIGVHDSNARLRLSNQSGDAVDGITLRSDGNTSIANISSELAATGNHPTYRMWRYRGTLETPTATQASDRLGEVGFGGHDGSAGSSAAFMAATALGNWATTNHGTKLEFHTSQQGNFPAQLAMTLEGNQDATFEGSVLSKGNVTVQGPDGYNASGEKARLYLGDSNASVYGEHSYGMKFDVFGKTEALRIRESTGNVEIAGTLKIEGGNPGAGKVLVSDAAGVGTWTDASGNAQGPASSTDNALARFDGTAGKTLQNSGVTLSDTGAMDGLTSLNANGPVTADGVIGTNTAPLADNERLRVTAASADTFDNSRAASIDFHGVNHLGNPGRLDLVGGGTGDITFWAGGFQRGTVSGTTGYWGIGSDATPTVGLDMVGTSLLGGSIRNRTYTNDNSVGNFTQLKYRGTAIAPAAVQSGDFLSDMRFGGYDSAQDALALQMFTTATENWTASARGSQFTIASSKTGTTATDNAFRIDGANNAIVYEKLGVGTTSPDTQAKVHIDGGATGALRVSGSSQGRMLLDHGGAAANQRLKEIQSLSGNIQFSTIDDAQATRTTHMTITNDSFVGIGTSAVNARLQLPSDLANRKVVLYETANNDHQYYGFGINGGTLRYQVDGSGGSHKFYAGNDASSSTLLVNIKGDKSTEFNGHVQITGPDGYDSAGEQGRLYLGDTNASVYSEYGFGMKFDVFGKVAALRIKENSGIVEFIDKVKIEGGSPATGKKLICADNAGNAQWGTADTLTVQGTNGVALSSTFATVATLTLPRAGKYKVVGVARYSMDQKDSWSVAKLRNVTDSNDVGLSENLAWSTTAAMQVVNRTEAIITVTAAKVIDLEVATGNGAWTGTSLTDGNGRTKIWYEEL